MIRICSIEPRVAVLVCLFASGAIAADSQAPYQEREPEKFWMQQTVFQKKGIVIEDSDYVVRKRYWVLDPTVKGRVVEVDRLLNEVLLSVRFQGISVGWREHGDSVRNRRVETTRRAVRVNGWYEGGKVEADEVKFSYEIEGVKVSPERCGVITLREGQAVVVRFPSHLLSLEPLRKGDRVVRSWDWDGGFADGGNNATSSDQSTAAEFFGVVDSERDRHGFVAVTWAKTGRKKLHRYDHRGYFEIQKSEEEKGLDNELK